MKTELEHARALHRAMNLPMRDQPDSRVPHEELLVRRRLVRVESDEFLKEGLWKDDLVACTARMIRFVYVIAGTLAQFGVEPDIRDFATGATLLIEDARQKFDKALAVCDWPELRIAAAQLEIVWYGMAGSLGLPYFDLLEVIGERYKKAQAEDPEEIRALLVRAGLLEPTTPPAANDAG